MAQTASRNDGEIVHDFLSVAGLLEQPQLARIYAYLYREGDAPVQELMDALDLPQGSAYTYVNRLTDAGVLTITTDAQPHQYGAVEIELTLTVDSEREYTISPILIDAVARRTEDETIDSYIDRRGIHGLAIALTHTVARERGETTHRLVADDLDLSALEAEVIMQALRPVVREYCSFEDREASLAEVVDAEDLDA
ncbi:winged helix-turn-helix domain-containing protein [Halocatena salina]|uniref:Winged helix-turn-helix domain-containing protein n=1 Tax=Halocatena salina TaxID=2934340 RepID=A0A8U0A2M6_9EURY|nr:winged helix-turn-helix domain-containing protein [Halocatena salina]UPM43461.1 winged helix-turn-helix domain-containing protein [Halocatena salina]